MLLLHTSDIAYQNKAVIYDLLFKASAETLITIAADPKHLGARIGAFTLGAAHLGLGDDGHHPHVHMIVPGGGIALDGERWVSCRPGFFPARARSFQRLFRDYSSRCWSRHTRPATFCSLATRRARRYAGIRRLSRSVEALRVGRLQQASIQGPEAVLAYLSRYTHRVAISNSRLIALDAGVTFKWKDYRAKGRDRAKVMTLAIDEFIRRFLIHVLPSGFHRIRHYGLFASAGRAENIARARELLHLPKPQSNPTRRRHDR